MAEDLGSSLDSGYYSKIGTYCSYNPLDGKETHDEENMITDLIAEVLCKESDCAAAGSHGAPIIPLLIESEKRAGSGRRSMTESMYDDDRREIELLQFDQSCFSCLKICPSSLKLKILSLLTLLVGVVMILLIAIPGVCPYFPSPVLPLADPDGFGSVRDIQKQNKLFNILFYGDSMLKEPLERYDLVGRISKYLPSYKFAAKIVANNAVKMTNLREHIENQLKSIPALDGIIVMCDSDITDVVFDKISENKVAELLAAYRANLIYIITAAQTALVPIAISSPIGVLLEGPLGAPNSVRYHYKKKAVAAYTEATRDIAHKMGVPYVDVRTETLAAIPFYRQYYLGCVTYDGEHPNARGTDIFAKLYAHVLLQWFYTALADQK